jgi:hypothetical protein
MVLREKLQMENRKEVVEAFNAKFTRMWNVNSTINASTAVRGDGSNGRMGEIMQFMAEKKSCSKLEIVNTLSNRTFKNGTECRGYWTSYFIFLNNNKIIAYSHKTKKWTPGKRFNEFSDGIAKLKTFTRESKSGIVFSEPTPTMYNY